MKKEKRLKVFFHRNLPSPTFFLPPQYYILLFTKEISIVDKTFANVAKRCPSQFTECFMPSVLLLKNELPLLLLGGTIHLVYSFLVT